MGKQDTVGGDADLVNTLCRCGSFTDGQDVFLDQRFTTGDPQLGDAKRGGNFHSLDHFLFRQHGSMALFTDTVLRHTVTAAQIALIRYGKPQIIDLSAVSVDHT